MPHRASRVVRVAAVLAIAALAAWWFAAPWMRSAALLADLTGSDARWRSFLPVRQQPVTEADVSVATRHGVVPARVYRPTQPELSLIVFPGVHAGGIDEPRLVALSRRIAAAGALVLAVPLPDLREYRISVRSTDTIEDAIRWMAAMPSLAPSGRVGLVGVSFAGGLALVAAGRPGMSERLTAVFGLGIHGDLPRVLRYLTSSDEAPAPVPPHDYGLVLMLRSAAPMIVPPDQRAAFDEALVRQLDAASATSTDQAEAERLFAEARALGEALAPPSRDLMQAVFAHDIAALGRELAPFVEQLGGEDALSPLRSPLPDVPVFLLHGQSDSVIPARESMKVAQAIEAAGGEVEVLITPLITHADPMREASAGDLWRLVRFWTRLWDALRP